MIEAVNTLIRSVAAQAILPRFRSLRPDDISEKSAGEIVTAADREAEYLLASGLKDLLPGSMVVGEEGAAAQPELRSHLKGGRHVWLVDPLDGTSNFVKGDSHFAVMVALIERGETVASWMLDPLTDCMAVAERGSGAFFDSDRIRTSETSTPAQDLRGAILTRFLPSDLRSHIDRCSDAIGTILPGLLCADMNTAPLPPDRNILLCSGARSRGITPQVLCSWPRPADVSLARTRPLTGPTTREPAYSSRKIAAYGIQSTVLC